MTEPRLALWAGPECTVNRVGDEYIDQLECTGFAGRLDDIDRLASLGIERMRFPLLWERTAPGALEEADWSWPDERLARLRALGVAPIVGLLHHGSGPRHTDLLDPEFPDKLAAYAAAVAQRYPWVDAYTPVNEPLTTARFAGLYGLWYPHGRDDKSFVRALLNQVRGTVLAMQAIRRVNPAAQLVQTDDLGFTSSTGPLAYQARFDNTRRWLGFDLLFGRVTRSHPLWRYLRANGATAAELQALVDRPCPPDIVGINSYVTSERFLDHRLAHYPPELHGGNRRHRYADTEAARVCGTPIGGFAARLREAHERYRCALAITEVHMGCTREEQLRWLRDAWDAANTVRAEGVDLRGLTVWAAFGACDWDSLLTRRQGHYEPGLWDVRSPEPRLTALGELARQLGRGEAFDHPALDSPGWWQREVRLVYPVHGEAEHKPVQGRPLLITGATGTLGRAFARMCELRGLPHHLLRREEMDIADPASVAAALARWQPWALVNTAGYVRVDDAEADERQWRENALGPAVLAAECARAGVRLLTFSSDLVFGGDQSSPYEEHDAARPLNAYGRAKLAGERDALARWPQALVVRTAAFFGPWDVHNFVSQGLARLQRDEPWIAAHDQVVSPTYVPDLVQAALDLLVDGERGVWHLANDGAVSWAEFACRAAEAAGMRTAGVRPEPAAALRQRAPRPSFSALGSARGQLMPTLDAALERYVEAWRATG
ncbi:family 1 glycosylhydrolase [Ideonella sp. BN130291]|uniref:family 1 glycosylhydrolase n=1 Tax=Ideonella sp. BN130291 TaxID=3112940 RepID=UPI002E26D466|nr:family 1 glycosylhydrolase [Ideonella sp. BN130291]